MLHPGHQPENAHTAGSRRRARLAWPLLGALAIASAPIPPAAHAEGLDAEREIAPFVSDMLARHRFERADLERILTAATVRPDVVAAMSRQAESLDWHQYRPMFVTSERIDEGVEFWSGNDETLARASEKFGVTPAVIVAIIGVETRYGRRMGRHRVLDSLATLAFRFPRRASFFRGELEAYLLLARDEGLDAVETTGSFAGAMGIPQFIPSSYRHYAVDFDGDGSRNLIDSVPDAIGSVANYLEEHGWQSGQGIALPAAVSGGEYRTLLARGSRPHTVLSDMASFGVVAVDASGSDALGALIELDNRNGPEHWIGLQNFYAITRYNHSNLYAMAVFQLGREIEREYRASGH